MQDIKSKVVYIRTTEREYLLKDEATQITPLGDQLRDVIRLLNCYKDMCMPNVS